MGAREQAGVQGKQHNKSVSNIKSYESQKQQLTAHGSNKYLLGIYYVLICVKVRPWSLPPQKTLGLIGRKTYEVLSTQYSEGSRRGEPRGLWGQKREPVSLGKERLLN